MEPLPNFYCSVAHPSTGITTAYYVDQPEAAEQASNPTPLVVSREDFESLPIESGTIGVQPDRGWALVNMPTVVWSDAAEHVLTTTVLGIPVQVRAVPISYAWDFGDGSPELLTEDPGAPWPDGTVTHTYSTPQEATQISVRTQWRGQFRPIGARSWRAVTGTASTTSVLDPIEIVAAEPRLVAGG